MLRAMAKANGAVSNPAIPNAAACIVAASKRLTPLSSAMPRRTMIDPETFFSQIRQHRLACDDRSEIGGDNQNQPFNNQAWQD